ncbi:MAG: insulinase family protein [Clostridia bacterium]|nr:insulinase family protein [Clostridia bacterium]
MAKPQIIECDNGATVVYQKQKAFNGASFVIGFRSGAQLDGEYKGLSHLLEHLLFREVSEDLTKNILNNILQYSINQNAYTSKDSICVSFSAVDKNINLALDNAMHMITKTNFTEKQIKNEIEVVKQEINLNKIDPEEEEIPVANLLLESLQENPDKMTSLDILGSAKTLNMVTPDILKKYIKRYFNLDNLVISVTSNKSMDEVMTLIEDKIFSKLKPAQKAEYIVDYPELPKFKEQNVLMAVPDDGMHNVTVDLLIRENSANLDTVALAQMDKINQRREANKKKPFADEDIDNYKYAMEVIESYIMNNIGGKLWSALRGKKGLVYSYAQQVLDFGTARFTCLEATTNGSNLQATTRKLCEVARELGSTGIEKQTFKFVKQALVDQKNATLQKFKNCSAQSNYNDFLLGIPTLDYEVVTKMIEEIDYDMFNEYVKTEYFEPNISVAVEGKFDSRKCYNLVEIEQMAGNNNHKQAKTQLNTPVMQMTGSVKNVPENVVEIVQAQMPKQEPAPEVPKIVKIDDKTMERKM